MPPFLQAGLSLLSGLVTAWNQARTIYNAPDMIKAKVSQAHQDYRDALNRANAILANPNSTKADHDKALDIIRRADS